MHMKVNFTIAGQTKDLQTHQILELCDYLTAKVLEPMFARQGVKSEQGVRRTPSPASMKAVYRRLEEVKRFAQWALSHNYRHLAAA